MLTPTQRAELHDAIAVQLDRIKRLFKPGARVTLLVRQPHLSDGGVLLTDDDIEVAIAEIRKLMERDS